MSESSGVKLHTPDGDLRPMEEIEADVIRLAIGFYGGRMTEVARRLGIMNENEPPRPTGPVLVASKDGLKGRPH